MKIPNIPELSGAVVMERGTSFVAKIIINQMAKYAEERQLTPLPYSHMETLIWNDSREQLYTVGARKPGAEMSHVNSYYGKHDIEVWVPVKPLTELQNAKLWQYWQWVDASKYQYGKLLDWLLYNEFGWKLAKQGQKKNICYELAARFSNAIGLWQGKDIDYATPYDFVSNANYKLYKP